MKIESHLFDWQCYTEVSSENGGWSLWTFPDCDDFGNFGLSRLCNNPAPTGKGDDCPGSRFTSVNKSDYCKLTH